MGRNSILIISDKPSDHLQLSKCLQRAQTNTYSVISSTSIERPIELLLDPSIKAAIIAESPETEYLLRLAQKNNSATAIIVLLDDCDTARRIAELGLQDYLLRGQLYDALVQRVVNYSIQLKQARRTIDLMSSYDSLSGALNRIGFRPLLKRAVERSQQHKLTSALLYFNVDNFAHINGHYGEQNGDLLIKTLADRITDKLGHRDCLARLNGDEFAVLIEEAESAEHIEELANNILLALTIPITLNEQPVVVNTSLGLTLFSELEQEQIDPMEAARKAMLHSKSLKDRKHTYYDRQLAEQVSMRSNLATELRSAIHNVQFELYYQPRIDLSSERLVGLEALLRWNHPQRGLLEPLEFLNECEDIGLMKSLGYQVIWQACKALNCLAEQGLGQIDIGVNVSFSQLQDKLFPSVVKSILSDTSANAKRLEFELTESTVLQNPNAIKARMNELKELGISFSLDDFGTGFSQLSHLTTLPIASLKVDATFVRELPQNTQQAAVCSMIIKMAQELGIVVIAEGTETYEQVAFLRQQQCHQVQGFYYSPAIPLQHLPRFLEQQRIKAYSTNP